MMPWPPRNENEPIDWGDEPVEPPPPPTAGRSIRLGFTAVYDYMGTTIAASLIAFIGYYFGLAPFFRGLTLTVGGEASRRSAGIFLMGLVVLIAPLILGPLTAGLFNLARAMFRHDDPHLLDIWRGAVRLARPGWALGYTQTFVHTVLISDMGFLLSRPGAPFKVAGVVVGYVLLFWGMAATYQWALLVEHERPLGTTVRNSAAIAAANPFYTLGVTLLVGLLLVLPVAFFFTSRAGAAALIPVSLFWGALIPCLQTAATLEILRKYEDTGTK